MIIDGWVNLPRLEGMEISPELAAVASFFGPGAEELYKDTSVEELNQTLDAAGIDGALLCGYLPFRSDGMQLAVLGFDEAWKALETSPKIRLTLGVPGLRDIVPMNRMIRELATDDRVLGVLIGAAPMGIDLTDKRMYAVYATLAEVGLPLICNTGILGPPRPSKHQHPMLLEEVCSDFPELTVVAAHMGHPWEKLLVRLMMKFPNLYLMTSAYLPKYIDQSVIDYMQTSRGAKKVMFASDFPMLDPARCLAEARKLPLSEETLAAYLGGNLAKALNWK
jgi:predicted TIM-barrel fold metal-dependent hydrolase